jgi:hypothetical protein
MMGEKGRFVVATYRMAKTRRKSRELTHPMIISQDPCINSIDTGVPTWNHHIISQERDNDRSTPEDDRSRDNQV